MPQMLRAVAAAVIVLASTASGSAATVTVAVASNFADTAETLAAEFERSSGHDVVLVRGSSGKLFAQIVNEAPIDVFLSADSERPRKLLARDNRDAVDAFVYAVGELVIWSRDAAAAGLDCSNYLQTARGRVAIANPRLAPYGRAAREYLEQASLWARLEPQLVLGENISQALQFVASGNAVVGLVARSQLQLEHLPAATCRVDVPAFTHAPIEQVGVLTRRGLDNPAAAAMVAYLQSVAARAIIRAGGYRLPEKSAPDHRDAP